MSEIISRLISPVLRKDWAIVHHIIKDTYTLSTDEYENFVCYIIANMKKAETENDVIQVIKKALHILEKVQK